MSELSYSSPVSVLLTLGEGRRQSEWPDYSAYGLTEDHIPDLIRMVTDEQLHMADAESGEPWAPLHAWRALGQLRAESAIEPLVNLLNRIDLKVDDWVQVELPDVLAMIGPAAIPALDRFLADPDNGLWARGAAAGALSKIGVQYAEARDRCVELVTSQLQRFREQDLDLNALLIDALVELHAVESAPVIAEAFAADKVELSLRGDLGRNSDCTGLA